MFKNKILLITGGTGSFGNSVLKALLIQILRKLEFSVEMRKSRRICELRTQTLN